MSSLIEQVGERFSHGGIPSGAKHLSYVNLREIRSILFGTQGAQTYFDSFYGIDLEVCAHGNFSIRIVDPEKFMRNFVPANTVYYSFDDPDARRQILGEFLQSFYVALNVLSNQYRLAELPSHLNEMTKAIMDDKTNAGTWEERFGFILTSVAIEEIDYSDRSMELINTYAEKKIDVSAYENVSRKAADIATQQKIADGIKRHGFGDGAGMMLGMDLARGVGKGVIRNDEMSMEKQIELVSKLKTLLDSGAITQEEFDRKKSEILDL